MKAITIINHKGGVGKTTITQNLTAGLIKRGYKVLLIELDAQANSTYLYGAEQDHDIMQALLHNASITELIQHTSAGDIIAGTENLSKAERYFFEAYGNRAEQYTLLKAELQILQGLYDYVLIDTPPALNGLSINAVISADYVLIPVKAELTSVQALVQLSDTLRACREANADTKVLGIVINLYRKNNLHNSILEALEGFAKELDTEVIPTVIYNRIDYADAQANLTNIYDYRKQNGSKSKCIAEFDAFVEEVMKRIEQ